MGQSYFDFKRFRVSQAQSGMKVSTDACILGAYVQLIPNGLKALDIGCGTGLLSLMLAQRYPQVSIDAVELDADAAEEASINVQQSPFAKQIHIHQGDIRHWKDADNKGIYDCIICNPPFFENSLRNEDEKRRQARHTDSLSFIALAEAIHHYLSDHGQAAVLLPAPAQINWEKALTNAGLSVLSYLFIAPFAHKAPNRFIAICSRQKPTSVHTANLSIYEQVNIYTEEFKALLRPYYLYL